MKASRLAVNWIRFYLNYEPPKSITESKAAIIQTTIRLVVDSVRGGVCGFAAAFADVGVCARAAVRGWAWTDWMDCSLCQGTTLVVPKMHPIRTRL
jgi:hypothetical protein